MIIIKNCKRAVDDGKKEKAGSFLFPSLPARFYFPSLPPPPPRAPYDTKRPLQEREEKLHCRTKIC